MPACHRQVVACSHALSQGCTGIHTQGEPSVPGGVEQRQLANTRRHLRWSVTILPFWQVAFVHHRQPAAAVGAEAPVCAGLRHSAAHEQRGAQQPRVFVCLPTTPAARAGCCAHRSGTSSPSRWLRPYLGSHGDVDRLVRPPYGTTYCVYTVWKWMRVHTAVTALYR